MENRKEERLIDEFNGLVSEISKNVFDKSIYRDLKMTEENLIKTLNSTSEKTATINRNNLISLQNNLKVILDDAISDFNLGVENGEKAFERDASKFLKDLENLTKESKSKLYIMQEKAKDTSCEIDILNDRIASIKENVFELSTPEGINNLNSIKATIEEINKNLELSNKIAFEHVKKIEEMDKMLKGDCLRILNCVNKLENKIKVDKSDTFQVLEEYKGYIDASLLEVKENMEAGIDEFKDLLEEENTNLDNFIELINSSLPKYNSDVIDSVRRVGDKVNALEKKVLLLDKKESTGPAFNEEIKSEFDKKYNFLVLMIAIIGVLAILF
ncbi:hypothetical protein [Clostridium sp. B9]|uniref:hypothetical protein n=1 Tax=Clostridium sp. B9 TaxID=3423224 RepID=UPI003D2EBD6D